ncbi:MAG: right-handed parallel beta-helix repeat-containing protein [Deltaproteobacteria bacterium]|nr:MAG: right-handed parallel beta-helix repeat-containing protein [Deltaproteobacteria bacterium]
MRAGRVPGVSAAAFAQALLLAFSTGGGTALADTFQVPGDFDTIQQAIDGVADGDTIHVAPGIYAENLTVRGKHVFLESDFVTTGERADIDATVIDGGNGSFVLEVHADTGSAATLRGFTLRNADDGITPRNPITFRDGRITGTQDGIDFEDGSVGVILDSVFDGNGDDGLDLDDRSAVRIAGCVIADNGQDGIEIRLQDFAGDPIEVIIEDNWIVDNGEDGIQLIDYGGLTPRTFIFERNVFVDNVAAAIGMMCAENTDENFEGCPIPEPVLIANNTFVRNSHAVSGGVNVTAVNNLFLDQAVLGVKNVTGGSFVAYSLFWGNGADAQDSNVDDATTTREDPRLLETFELAENSPAIDAGAASFVHGAFAFELDPSEYSGSAPDLGAVEFVPEPAARLARLTALACAALCARRRARPRGPREAVPPGARPAASSR